METRQAKYSFRGRLALAAVAVVSVVSLFGLCPVSAQETSATRTFDMPTVAPGSRVVVTLAVAGYGGFGALIETLPPGFNYVSSSTHPGAVSSGQEVSFVLFGDSSVTYTVTAPASEGPYRFDGTLRHEDRNDHAVGGASTLTVGAPTPEPTAEPTPPATAEPTPDSTPEPTQVPTSVPTPIPTVAPTSTPTIAPTATPTAAPTPASIPIVPVVDDGGMPGWVIPAIVIGVLLMIVAGTGLFISSRQQSV